MCDEHPTNFLCPITGDIMWNMEDLNQVDQQIYLLTNSMEEGEISTTEYFIELKSLYEIKDNLLDIEKDYQLLLNQLNKFELLKHL